MYKSTSLQHLVWAGLIALLIAACGEAADTDQTPDTHQPDVPTTACTAETADCDGQSANGCETDLTTQENCGACDNVCTAEHGTVLCESSACVATCDVGWEGERCDVDSDECTDGTNNCDANATCTNTIGSFECACNEGYQGDGWTCHMIHDCTPDAGDCGANATCTDMDGKFTCVCNEGYQGDGLTCDMIHDCTPDADDCDANATCTNMSGKFTCVCNDGYQGDGTTCANIDECAAEPGPCDDNATCNDTDGDFTCTCNTGYSGDETVCTDDDECALGTDNCADNATCTNTDGGFTCACNGGYEGDGLTCTDVDECSLGTDNCHEKASCNDTDGAFECWCIGGYDGDGTVCTDVNECLESNGGCDALTQCTNTEGSYECGPCPAGYTGDGNTGCVDIDECTVGTAKCPINAVCTNNGGSYSCPCPVDAKPGTQLALDSAEDAVYSDGWGAEDNGGVGYAAWGDPVENTGGGMYITGGATALSGTRSFGVYASTGGFAIARALPNTSDTGWVTFLAKHNVANDVAFSGFNIKTAKGDSFGANEAVAVGMAPGSNDSVRVYGTTDQTIVMSNDGELRGDKIKYKIGWSQTGAFMITITNMDEDIEKVVEGNLKTESTAIGVIGMGNFNSGSEQNLLFDVMSVNQPICLVCSPIHHCESGLSCTNNLDATCGTCEAGYELGIGNKDCVDVDECLDNNGGCDALTVCNNTDGGSECGPCPSGYDGDGIAGCTDINECLDNNGGCDAMTDCTNSDGGFTCGDCPEGYAGGGAAGCTDINECDTNNGGCDALTQCTNSEGGYDCGDCPAGYDGDGDNGCTDINECTAGTHDCDANNNTCANTIGGFDCLCDWSLDVWNGSWSFAYDETCMGGDPSVLTFDMNCGAATGDQVNCDYSIEGIQIGTCDVTVTTDGCNSFNLAYTNCTLTGPGYTNTSLVSMDNEDNASGTFNASSGECGTVTITKKSCAVDNGGCDANATCSTVDDIVTCSCKPGWAGTGTSCADIDECLTNNGGCDPLKTCTNALGGFACGDCPNGYEDQGGQCIASCVGPTCVGSAAPTWQLADKQPGANEEVIYGLDQFQGKVVVLALLESS